MLANNNKSVAVSGGHIPSYDSNRWAILTGLPSPCLCPSVPQSVCPSVLSVSRLSNSTPVFPSQTSLPAVFIPHIIFWLIFAYLESCSGWLSSRLCIFFSFFYFTRYSHVFFPKVVAIVKFHLCPLRCFRWHNVPSGGQLKALYDTVFNWEPIIYYHLFVVFCLVCLIA